MIYIYAYEFHPISGTANIWCKNLDGSYEHCGFYLDFYPKFISILSLILKEQKNDYKKKVKKKIRSSMQNVYYNKIYGNICKFRQTNLWLLMDSISVSMHYPCGFLFLFQVCIIQLMIVKAKLQKLVSFSKDS